VHYHGYYNRWWGYRYTEANDNDHHMGPARRRLCLGGPRARPRPVRPGGRGRATAAPAWARRALSGLRRVGHAAADALGLVARTCPAAAAASGGRHRSPRAGRRARRGAVGAMKRLRSKDRRSRAIRPIRPRAKAVASGEIGVRSEGAGSNGASLVRSRGARAATWSTSLVSVSSCCSPCARLIGSCLLPVGVPLEPHYSSLSRTQPAQRCGVKIAAN
jgi:hypothetical protein